MAIKILKGKKVIGKAQRQQGGGLLVKISTGRHRVYEKMTEREFETFIDYFGYHIPSHLEETLSPT